MSGRWSDEICRRQGGIKLSLRYLMIRRGWQSIEMFGRSGVFESVAFSFGGDDFGVIDEAVCLANVHCLSSTEVRDVLLKSGLATAKVGDNVTIEFASMVEAIFFQQFSCLKPSTPDVSFPRSDSQVKPSRCRQAATYSSGGQFCARACSACRMIESRTVGASIIGRDRPVRRSLRGMLSGKCGQLNLRTASGAPADVGS